MCNKLCVCEHYTGYANLKTVKFLQYLKGNCVSYASHLIGIKLTKISSDTNIMDVCHFVTEYYFT